MNCYFLLAFFFGLVFLLIGLISFVHLEKTNTTSKKLPYYMLIFTNIISCLTGILYLVSTNTSYKLINEINAKKFKVEGMALPIIIFSAFLIVLSSTALSTAYHVGESIGTCYLKILYTLAIIEITLGFIHFFVIYFEQRTFIKATFGVLSLL